MAKPTLTIEAIKFIVKEYNSETENNTFGEIANKVKEKFNIEVTLQAVQQNYHKYNERYKEKKGFDVEQSTKKVGVDKEVSGANSTAQSPVPENDFLGNIRKSKEKNPNASSQQFDDAELSSSEINDLLKPGN